MSLCIAIERTKTSLLAAVVEQRAALSTCIRVDLAETAKPAEVAAALRAALPDVRWAKAKLVVVVGGDDVQLRQLNLPPAPESELPAMVQMLAGKELAATDEDAIDFLPIRTDSHGNVVLAARLADALLTNATQIAKQLDASLERVVLRACAAVSLVTRIAAETTSGPRLVATPAATGMDLVAINSGEPMLIRSTRSATAEALQAEIRRTLPVASQVLDGPPAAVTVIGSPASESALSTPAGELSMRVVDLSNEALTRPAFNGMNESEWTPLVGVAGAALEAADARLPAIDFLSPRQASNASPDTRRQLVLAALAAAVLVLGALVAYGRLVAMDRQIADLQADAQRLNDSAETLRPYQEQVARLDAWRATDVTWLDEFEQLGRRLRPELLASKNYSAGDDVFVTSLWLRPPTGVDEGGQMELRAAARNPAALGALEQRLRDARHEVQPISVTERGVEGKYPWAFRTLIRVAPPSANEQPQSDDAPASKDEAEAADE